jgi:hypothetical protein
MVATIRMALRCPKRSDIEPMASPASAQASENAPPMMPMCVLVRPRSGAMLGVRIANALRSKNTTPKCRLNTPMSTHW